MCSLSRLLIAFALWLPGAAGAQTAPVADPGACAEPIARKVQERYDSIHDFTARFVQTTRRVSLGVTGETGTSDRARGSVVFAKPGRMRWSYEQPEPSLVVSDGETLWIYDPQAHEAQRLAVGQAMLSGTAIQFLLGEGDLLETFAIRAEACDTPTVHLELVPREPASYERLALRVDRASGQVVETQVVDLFGNVTQVAFAGIETNRNPSPESFRFEPPSGVRVIVVPEAR